MAVGINARPSDLELDRLARQWFAEIREAQRVEPAAQQDRSRQDGADDLGDGILDWLIGDGDAGGGDSGGSD